MIGSMNRPGDRSNIIYLFNIQRKILYNTEASLKYFVIQVFASAMLLILVVKKRLTEDLFAFDWNLYTPINFCTPVELYSILTTELEVGE